MFAAKEGLIVLSGGERRAFVVAAEKCRSGSSQSARALRWQAQFGDNAYYLELTRCGRQGEEEALRRSLRDCQRLRHRRRGHQ